MSYNDRLRIKDPMERINSVFEFWDKYLEKITKLSNKCIYDEVFQGELKFVENKY